ncbi:excitatory amino acid transporter 4-like isoform X1 [Limanda limanda]|uniref:excitatory amino acid transporter 4-like isoform X1 n=1 Tax=Limanda limanda TaxID=27771 RepID=UPI0029C667F6|nr:excitatory amino acid transporter 4-like isoform X1 [Limanda limanda]XP_060940035.1 excitatory amino acid transporter 4-like isoform X1 [Limanda limanda]XP_060940036.1 excitatory amino acid transporter 4-like isoform X1 [Limanda limanda]
METVCLQSELDSVEVAEPQEIQTYHRCNILAFLKRNLFVILTVTAVASGIGLGFALRSINMSDRDVRYLMFPGELLLRLLQMLMLPLIVSSLISGTSSVDRKAYGRIGLRAICYYLLTTLIAAFTGIILAVIIQPGNWSRNTSASSGGHAEAVQTVDAILDLIRNMIPSNLVEACFRKFKTVYSRSDSTGFNITEAGENSEIPLFIYLQGVIFIIPINIDTIKFHLLFYCHHLDPVDNTVPVPGSSDGMNMLGLLVFSVAFGLILGGMGSQGKPLRDFFDCLNTAVMSLVNIFIWYSPVGILFLMAGQVVKMTDMGEIGLEVGMYTLTVIAGLLIHSFLTLPLIYFSVTRKNPFRFMSGVLQALATAFGTSSSSATLPVTLHCMEVNHSMDTRVTRFLLPTGATMNMDGAALYEAVAALFIAQLHNMNFGLGQIIVLSLIVTASSTGGAGIPQAGLVTMMIVLSSAGLPTENISLLIMVDWILDRLRTTTNVLGDCIGVGVVQHLSRRELQSSEPAGESLMEENLHL